MHHLTSLGYWPLHAWHWTTSASYRWHVRWCNHPEQRQAMAQATLRRLGDAVPILPDTTMGILVGGQVVYGVHARYHCRGERCSIHNPTAHPMAAWRQNWRSDRKIMERICQHGIGHPDPDHLAFVRSRVGPIGGNASGVHGCDGCCSQPEED